MLGIKVKEFIIKGERYSYTQGCMLQIEDKWEVYKDGNKYYHYCKGQKPLISLPCSLCAHT